jgi:hypothetical protein
MPSVVMVCAVMVNFAFLSVEATVIESYLNNILCFKFRIRQLSKLQKYSYLICVHYSVQTMVANISPFSEFLLRKRNGYTCCQLAAEIISEVIVNTRRDSTCNALDHFT